MAVLSLSAIVFAQGPKPAPTPAEQKQAAKGGPPKVTPGTKQEPTNEVAQTEPQLVKVTITTSRPEVTTDGAYGIFADLQNVDSVPLTLYPADTILVIQPEAAGDRGCVFSIEGFYPTEPDKSKKPPLGGSIIIQPKEHYVAFWDVSKPSTGDCKGQQGKSAKRSQFDRAGTDIIEQLSFVPGDYAFVALGKAHRTPDGKEELEYHTFTEQVKLRVGLTQLNAIVAAVIGGLIGYFVMALRGGEGGEFAKLKREQATGERHWSSRWGVIVRGLVSAALVSAVVTVLLSRISDTQFPIKVSVADFWGALTVGFVAYFSGNKLIDRIVGLASKSGGEAPGGTPAPATPAPTTPGPATPAPGTSVATAPASAKPGPGQAGAAAANQGGQIPQIPQVDVFTPVDRALHGEPR
jgi:hypothetical protein